MKKTAKKSISKKPSRPKLKGTKSMVEQTKPKQHDLKPAIAEVQRLYDEAHRGAPVTEADLQALLEKLKAADG